MTTLTGCGLSDADKASITGIAWNAKTPVSKFADRLGPCLVHNGYGTTKKALEDTIINWNGEDEDHHVYRVQFIPQDGYSSCTVATIGSELDCPLHPLHFCLPRLVSETAQ